MDSYISSGITGDGIIAGSYNDLTVLSGGVMNTSTVTEDGTMIVSAGSVANSATESEYEGMTASAGGIVRNTSRPGGNYDGYYGYDDYDDYDDSIGSGEKVSNIRITGGFIFIWSGGTASNVIIDFPDTSYGNNEVIVMYGGVVSDVFICSNSNPFMTYALALRDGGVAKNITVAPRENRNGMWIYDFDDIDERNYDDISMSISCQVLVESGCKASNVTLGSGCVLVVEKGGKVTGLVAEPGSKVFAQKGSSVKYKNGKPSVVLTVSPNADDGWNNWLYDKKEKDLNWMVTSDDPAMPGCAWDEIRLDRTEDVDNAGWTNYVGYGDEYDYKKIHLDCAAKLSFRISASGASKFALYRLDEKYNWGNDRYDYTLKSLQTKKLAFNKWMYGYEAETKGILLGPGDYYISVQATDIKKGGGAYYDVSLGWDSVFFDRGDNSDDWTDLKWNGLHGEVDDFGPLDMDSYAEGWVGYGDEIDYRKFSLGCDAELSFTVNASDSVKLAVYRLVMDKKGNFSLKTLKNFSLSKNKFYYGDGTWQYTTTTKAFGLEAGIYFFSVKSTNAKKGGDADYEIYLNPSKTVFYSYLWDAETGSTLDDATASDGLTAMTGCNDIGGEMCNDFAAAENAPFGFDSLAPAEQSAVLSGFSMSAADTARMDENVFRKDLAGILAAL